MIETLAVFLMLCRAKLTLSHFLIYCNRLQCAFYTFADDCIDLFGIKLQLYIFNFQQPLLRP
ncbi:hypothetical protein WG68_07535 [Arsukibacterium ikkense]|uniref:Uncharacterized protein n=1 Tax=Arsukibacterium ikkense TaxID=336831 RepID=A0A0M2V887_9GAMM|nr:hypothetical protein WG68_07535 [Arsukibacterium ikkense]